jgi:hypothetical protein
MNHAMRHKALFICAIAVTLFVFSVYAYVYRAVGVSTARAVLARDIVNLEKQSSSETQNLDTLYDSTAEGREALSGFFVRADDVVPLIEELEALGDYAGTTVALSGITVSAPADKNFGTVRLRVDASGGWQSVMKVILLAETLPYAVTVDNARLTTAAEPGARSTGGKWQVSFEISALTQ